MLLAENYPKKYCLNYISIGGPFNWPIVSMYEPNSRKIGLILFDHCVLSSKIKGNSSSHKLSIENSTRGEDKNIVSKNTFYSLNYQLVLM